jgi:hypothetical protein
MENSSFFFRHNFEPDTHYYHLYCYCYCYHILIEINKSHRSEIRKKQ